MNASPAPLPLTVITHEFFPMMGGIATFVEEMATALHKLGHRTEVWAPQASAPVERRFPFAVRRVPLKGTQDLSCQLRMAREMVAYRQQLRRGIVYLPEPGPLLAMTYLQFFRVLKPARLVLTFHGSEVQSFAARPAARMLVGQLIRAADRISTPSQFTRRLLVRHFPAAAEKTVLTPGAVRAHFRSDQPVRGANGRKVVIVTVGRLHPRKGQLHILEALNTLPDSVLRDVEYWVIGRSVRGNYEARLRRRAADSRVPVIFHGNIDHDDLELIYRRSDIFALTSVNHGHSVEGFGLVYLEASASGLPVVGHDVGGVSEAVLHGQTGLLVPPEDRQALAAALEKLISNAPLRRQLGENGVRWARQHTWQDSARTLVEGLDSDARRPSPTLAETLQPA
ncbi:MAG: glycosyltransferase family 4 protein [Opitutaceae bacterium]|nr:glycosyltransferase family 4 protein [Opitutaceae bacterium]